MKPLASRADKSLPIKTRSGESPDTETPKSLKRVKSCTYYSCYRCKSTGDVPFKWGEVEQCQVLVALEEPI